MNNNPILLTITILFYWITLGIVSGWIARKTKKFIKPFFLLQTLGSAALIILCIYYFNVKLTLTLPLGIPHFPFQFHWDALSAFFILLLSISSFGISLFSSHYFLAFPKRALSLLCIQYPIFLASMVWVFLSADAFSFLIAWELMAISSYLLIVAFHQNPENQRAGFLYLFMAHVSGLTLLIGFVFLFQGENSFAFTNLTHLQTLPNYATLAFIFIFIGFGAKAGLVPLHIWLPEAHPAAPSPISALMSGVMLKTAIYGIIRIIFMGLGITHLWFSIALLVFGLFTAFLGICLAAMQNDMKRLLAYSSMENIGIIFAALGLTGIFWWYHLNALAIVTLCAALFHCLSHALFKSLLFLGTGNVLHATGQRNLGKLGGLIQKMPWVAAVMLLGILAIAGIPPLNGFVSEWLLLQAFLFSPHIPSAELVMLMPIAAAVFVLVIGLSAYVMVKFYGIIFLGKPREPQLLHAQDATYLERSGLIWLGTLCVLFGLFPFLILKHLVPLSAQIMNIPAFASSLKSNWFYIIPINASRASYSPIIFFSVTILSFVIIYAVIHYFYQGKYKRGAAWDCGFPHQTARMQDSAEGFGQPIKQFFAAFLAIKTEMPNPFDSIPHYHEKIEDRTWPSFIFPIVRLVSWCSDKIGKLQQGRINIYLLYSFLTLLFLLGWLLWY